MNVPTDSTDCSYKAQMTGVGRTIVRHYFVEYEYDVRGMGHLVGLVVDLIDHEICIKSCEPTTKPDLV